MAEKAAWDVCKQLGIDLVTINPDFVWGPPISANAGDATSMNLLRVSGLDRDDRSEPALRLMRLCFGHCLMGYCILMFPACYDVTLRFVTCYLVLMTKCVWHMCLVTMWHVDLGSTVVIQHNSIVCLQSRSCLRHAVYICMWCCKFATSKHALFRYSWMITVLHYVTGLDGG